MTEDTLPPNPILAADAMAHALYDLLVEWRLCGHYDFNDPQILFDAALEVGYSKEDAETIRAHYIRDVANGWKPGVKH